MNIESFFFFYICSTLWVEQGLWCFIFFMSKCFCSSECCFRTSVWLCHQSDGLEATLIQIFLRKDCWVCRLLWIMWQATGISVAGEFLFFFLFCLCAFDVVGDTSLSSRPVNQNWWWLNLPLKWHFQWTLMWLYNLASRVGNKLYPLVVLSSSVKPEITEGCTFHVPGEKCLYYKILTVVLLPYASDSHLQGANISFSRTFVQVICCILKEISINHRQYCWYLCNHSLLSLFLVSWDQCKNSLVFLFLLFLI